MTEEKGFQSDESANEHITATDSPLTVGKPLKMWNKGEVQPMTTGSTILVIDDEDIICESCRKVLTKEGYTVEIARDGLSGLKKVRQLRPDLALVDLKMPGMDGMEVLEKIKEIDPNIVTVVITGYATIESAVEAIKRGAYDFIPKPFTPDELRLITQRAFEIRRLALESAVLREEKEKMKRNFVTMVSHELKSPLVAVQQYFEVILGGMAGEITAEQREIMMRMSHRINRLLALINDWLSMAKVEAGKLVQKLEPLDLAPVLRRTIESLQPLAAKRGVRIESAFPDTLPVIRGDEDTLEEALTNLLINGIEYNRDNGVVKVGTEEEEAHLVVKIADTGIGISEKDLPFIFDDFFRVKSKETEGIMGTGLGLSIVKRIVEGHSGYINVTSESGRGTIFSIYLPKIRVDHR